MQHATGDKAARKNEEKTSVAADAFPKGQPDHWSRGRMRGCLSRLEDALSLGHFLYWTLTSGLYYFYFLTYVNCDLLKR